MVEDPNPVQIYSGQHFKNCIAKETQSVLECPFFIRGEEKVDHWRLRVIKLSSSSCLSDCHMRNAEHPEPQVESLHPLRIDLWVPSSGTSPGLNSSSSFRFSFTFVCSSSLIKLLRGFLSRRPTKQLFFSVSAPSSFDPLSKRDKIYVFMVGVGSLWWSVSCSSTNSGGLFYKQSTLRRYTWLLQRFQLDRGNQAWRPNLLWPTPRFIMKRLLSALHIHFKELSSRWLLVRLSLETQHYRLPIFRV